MKDRIKEFMDFKGLNAGELAGKLDVQPSNISHILHGRNKPSAAFIEKFLQVFPEINARWLLTGSGAIVENLPEVPAGNQVSIPFNQQESLTGARTAGDDKEAEPENDRREKFSNGLKQKNTQNSTVDITEVATREPVHSGISGPREEPPMTYGGTAVGMSGVTPESGSNGEKTPGVSDTQNLPVKKADISRVILLFEDGTFDSYDPSRP